MFLFWRGFGFLVPLIAVGLFFISVAVDLDKVLSMSRDDIFRLLLGQYALIFWFGGNYLNRKKSSTRHSFMFIPIQWWGIISMALLTLSYFGKSG